MCYFLVPGTAKSYADESDCPYEHNVWSSEGVLNAFTLDHNQ